MVLGSSDSQSALACTPSCRAPQCQLDPSHALPNLEDLLEQILQFIEVLAATLRDPRVIRVIPAVSTRNGMFS